MQFLADESCDFAVVRSLRQAGHDVTAIAEISPGVPDEEVAALAEREDRILVTEDRDFGRLVHAGPSRIAVIYLRFPASARSRIGAAVVDAIAGIVLAAGGELLTRNPRHFARVAALRLAALD